MGGMKMANFNLNKVILGGRLTADPELKTTPSGVSVVNFTIAVNRRVKVQDGEAQADFLNVTAWGKTAEFITRFFRKASSICIFGSIQNRSWVAQDGSKKYATQIIADEAYFVDSKSEEIRADNPDAGYSGVQSAPMPDATVYVPEAYMQSGGVKFEEIGNDDELPF